MNTYKVIAITFTGDYTYTVFADSAKEASNIVLAYANVSLIKNVVQE